MQPRASFAQISPNYIEETTRLTRDIIIPAAQREKGFRGYQTFGDRTTGRTIVITYWESESGREGSLPASDYYREFMANVTRMFIDWPLIDNIEIIVKI
jgi:quinol monooxygenase YgiN